VLYTVGVWALDGERARVSRLGAMREVSCHGGSADRRSTRDRAGRAELLAALSLAIDLGLGQPMEHVCWDTAGRLIGRCWASSPTEHGCLAGGSKIAPGRVAEQTRSRISRGFHSAVGPDWLRC
jgi:hypothetical protein